MRDFVVGTKPVSGLFLENPPLNLTSLNSLNSLNTCRDCANPLANTMKCWYRSKLHTEEKSGLTSSPYI